MQIKISWGSGGMVLSAAFIVEKMPPAHFKKWYKLFAQHGTNEQYREFLDYLTLYIGTAEPQCAECAVALEEIQMRIDGRYPTLMTREYWETEFRKTQRKLDSLARKVKRYKTMYEMVERLVS